MTDGHGESILTKKKSICKVTELHVVKRMIISSWVGAELRIAPEGPSPRGLAARDEGRVGARPEAAALRAVSQRRARLSLQKAGACFDCGPAAVTNRKQKQCAGDEQAPYC